jgi:hypothetical protein
MASSIRHNGRLRLRRAAGDGSTSSSAARTNSIAGTPATQSRRGIASLIIVALIALPSVLAFDGAFAYLQPDRFYLSFIDYRIGISQMKNEVIRVVDTPAARRPVYDRKGSQILVRRGGRRTDIHIG